MNNAGARHAVPLHSCEPRSKRGESVVATSSFHPHNDEAAAALTFDEH